MRSSSRSPAVLRFTATIRIRGINPFVHVSALRAAALRPGWRKPLPVMIRINGEPRQKPWRINMMPDGTGAFYLYLHGDVRRASNTGFGDRVVVEIAFDTRYRGGPARRLPVWFRAPLDENKAARAAWQALIPSRKKEILRYLMHLKTAEARKRNLARVLGMLAAS